MEQEKVVEQNQDLQLQSEVVNQIKTACTEAKYRHLCNRIQTENGMAYVANRCIRAMADDGLELGTALALLESEFEGMN